MSIGKKKKKKKKINEQKNPYKFLKNYKWISGRSISECLFYLERQNRYGELFYEKIIVKNFTQ